MCHGFGCVSYGTGQDMCHGFGCMGYGTGQDMCNGFGCRGHCIVYFCYQLSGCYLQQ